MILSTSLCVPSIFPLSQTRFSSSATPAKFISVKCTSIKPNSPSSASPTNSLDDLKRSKNNEESCPCCISNRRHFLEAAAASALLPICPSTASTQETDYRAILNKVRPPRPDWYEELFAQFMDKGLNSYKAESATYKEGLFRKLEGNAKNILEIGIGTGPNLNYYARNNDVHVIGVDPNSKMEKYARRSAEEAGLPAANFEFIRAVGEAIPLDDASVDAVVGTLVLCSVKDVDMTIKEVKRVLKPGGRYLFMEHVAAEDGTALRFVQSILDPLEQTLADGCHLTRETGKYISEARFSDLELSNAFLSFPIISPHVYGIACK